MSTNSIWQSVDPLILLGLCGGRFASNPPLAIIEKRILWGSFFVQIIIN